MIVLFPVSTGGSEVDDAAIVRKRQRKHARVDGLSRRTSQVDRQIVTKTDEIEKVVGGGCIRDGVASQVTVWRLKYEVILA